MSAIAADPAIFAATSPVERSRLRNLIHYRIIGRDRLGTGTRFMPDA